ncbi:MAG: sodium:proline symporter [Marinilabiliales bacterium]|nr:MAG: sodium:proline symporter [Marinilabiliales bacterium]
MIIVFILYLVATIGVAWWYSRGAKTNADYVIGGKKFGGAALALSERATAESAWLLLGLTGHAYTEGIGAIWVALGCVLGILFIWQVMAKRLRQETEKTGVMTVSGLIAKRFPGAEKNISIISSLIIIFFFLFYIAAQFSGAGLVLHKTFGLDPLWGVIIGSVVVIGYCIMGGFIAVVVTDILQAILMIFTLVIFPIIALLLAEANNIHIIQSIETAAPTNLSLTEGKTGMAAVLFILSGLSWAFGYTGQPQLLTRMMAIRNEKDVNKAKWVATTWTVLAYTGAILIGLFGIAFVQEGFLNHEQSSLASDAEKILPVMVTTLVNPIIAGFLLSGVISAMMSTASSELTVSASSLSEDIIGKLRKVMADDRKSLLLNKILTLIIGAAAFILAITLSKTVYGLVSYAWSGIGSSFGPAILLILFWKKISRSGIYASLITGTSMTIIWDVFFEAATGISERLASFVLAFIMAVLFSFIFPEKKY